MQKSQLLAALKSELHRHDFSHFIDEPPSVAQGGKGVVVSGCPACKKRINTMPQFLDHLTEECCRHCWTDFHPSKRMAEENYIDPLGYWMAHPFKPR